VRFYIRRKIPRTLSEDRIFVFRSESGLILNCRLPIGKFDAGLLDAHDFPHPSFARPGEVLFRSSQMILPQKKQRYPLPHAMEQTKDMAAPVICPVVINRFQ
jgi:hypothetical protein